MQLAAQSHYRPSYQFYHYNEIPIRPQTARQHHELFSKDQDSAYSASLEKKKQEKSKKGKNGKKELQVDNSQQDK